MTIQQERDDAIKIIQDACADGVIIEADRDQRIVQLKAAQSSSDIDIVLGHLKGRVPPAGVAAPVEVASSGAQPPTPSMPFPPPPEETGIPTMGSMLGSGRSLPFGSLIGGLVAVVAAIALVVFVVNLLSGVDLDEGGPAAANPTTGTTESQGNGTLNPPRAKVLSEEGFKGLVAAVKKETGSTSVFDATIYPEYAVLQLPVDRESARQQSYYWDGEELEDRDSFGKSTDPRFDLATINVEAMLRLSRRVLRIVEEPNSYYVILGAPDEHDGAVMYAYANNKFSEGAYVSADANGKVIRKVTW